MNLRYIIFSSHWKTLPLWTAAWPVSSASSNAIHIQTLSGHAMASQLPTTADATRLSSATAFVGWRCSRRSPVRICVAIITMFQDWCDVVFLSVSKTLSRCWPVYVHRIQSPGHGLHFGHADCAERQLVPTQMSSRSRRWRRAEIIFIICRICRTAFLCVVCSVLA